VRFYVQAAEYVVAMDEIDRGRNGILHRNIREFLLSGEY